jgi:hypothetical protein
MGCNGNNRHTNTAGHAVVDQRTRIVEWVHSKATQGPNSDGNRCIGNWMWQLHRNTQETFGMWDRSMATMPSNFRELAAVYLGLKSFSAVLQGKALTVLTDHTTTCAYLNHLGGPVQTLTKLAQAVWALVLKLDISLRAHYLPGIDNVPADNLSRQNTLYEWMLNPGLYHHIDQRFGPHTIDLFPSFQTRQLQRYNSRSYDPETEGIDALSQRNWHQEVNFVSVPFRFITKILEIVEIQSAEATEKCRGY